MMNRAPRINLVGLLEQLMNPRYCSTDIDVSLCWIPDQPYQPSRKHCIDGSSLINPLQPLDVFLEIEGAAGQHLPYSGYVELDLKVPEVDESLTSLFLVVPDTKYGQNVPVILGTNILCPVMDQMKEHLGDRYLQKANLTTPWQLAFRAINVETRALRRLDGRLSIIKLAQTSQVLIPSNKTVMVTGKLDKKSQAHGLGIVQPLDSSVLSADVEVAPFLVSFDPSTESIPICISNMTSRTISLSPSSILCQLQTCDECEPGSTDSSLENSTYMSSIMQKIDFSSFKQTAG